MIPDFILDISNRQIDLIFKIGRLPKKGKPLEKVQKQIEYFNKFAADRLLAMRNHAFKSSKEFLIFFHWKMVSTFESGALLRSFISFWDEP